MEKFLKNMVAKGKITQKEADAKLAKHADKEKAKSDYKAKGKAMTKAELQALLDILAQ